MSVRHAGHSSTPHTITVCNISRIVRFKERPLSGSIVSGDIDVPAVENGSTNAIISFQSGTELPIGCMNMLEEKRSRKDIARSCGVSDSTVGRWLQLAEYGKPTKLPMVVSVDEFKGNTEYGKFQGIVTDPVHKRVLDILPTCCEREFDQYFSSFSDRKQVRYFVCDTRREYISMAKRRFPNATVVIDRFHVVRYCTWALENVRKRVQKKLLPEQRKYFKRSRKLLLAHMDKLLPESKAAVERMLLFDRDLREAYLLKEVFYRFMASKDRKEGEQRLKEFRLHASVADIPEFSACLTMLQN